MNYIRQVFFEIRHQPLMSWLSIAGTSIAIFLIMSDFMISNIYSVNVAPESRRSRIYYGYGGDLYSGFIKGKGVGNTSSGDLSLELARELYSDLDGVEKVSFSSSENMTYNISVKGGIPENREVKNIDENFWQIYDYTFIEGVPFSKEEVDAGVQNVILTEKMAEHYFGKEDSYLGKEIFIANRPYIVTGIVKNMNPLMNNTFADAFITHVAAKMPDRTWATYLGDYQAILLLKNGIDERKVKQQVENRYKAFNTRHKQDDLELVHHNQPWTNEEKASGAGTNTTPDLTYKHRSRLIGYAILLLIPAINLSSMTRSRMRQRVSEIGLRRAFGCTRGRIMFDLLSENFVISLIGGLIGLGLSLIFIVSFSNYFISYSTWLVRSLAETMTRPSFGMLFSWKTFGAVLLFCFLLNILSAGIPAMKAAFTNPAEAISGHNIHK